MAENIHEVRLKIAAREHAIIDALACARGKDRQEIVRAWIIKGCAEEVRQARVVTSAAIREGMVGPLKPSDSPEDE